MTRPTYFNSPKRDSIMASILFSSCLYGHQSFTGKERDSETGYSDFGARYMDHALLTSFMSVDPLADKYPSISPYAYCAWNPVKLVDPDGEKIDSSSVSTRIWNMVDRNNDCYNQEFAVVFEQLANDCTTLFSFEEWNTSETTNNSEISGRFYMSESNIDQIDKAVIAFSWGPEGSSVASERNLFEEVYHAKQFLDGEFGFGRSTKDGSWNTIGLDMYDEEQAHRWADRVSGSSNSWTPSAIYYYKYDRNLPGSRRNVTEHYMRFDGIPGGRKDPPNYSNGVYKDTYRTMRKPKY